MRKFEFQILCENCESESDLCTISFKSLVKIGFDKKNIVRKINSSTHCISATIKLTENVDEEKIATEILECASDHVKQVIINPKLF